MASDYETFWNHRSYAVVGDAAKKNFPRLTYRGLVRLGKTVFPVDPSLSEVDGSRTYPTLDALPERVDAAVLEVPAEDTADWVARVADAGVEHVWIHMGRDTPQALDVARARGLHVRSGTCAVMYLAPGFGVHRIHRFVRKLAGTY